MCSQPVVWVALPAMNEAQWLPQTIEAIRKQQDTTFRVVVCVNQPEHYRLQGTLEEQAIVENNSKTLRWLNELKDFPLMVIDRSSSGKGWKKGKGSVGAARKIIMNHIAKNARDKDIILSMDADTTFTPKYFQSVCDTFSKHPHIGALANPYYHNTTGDPETDKAILRYEIYMRNYALNMFRIRNPYCFTALGSALATTAGMYQKINGITAKKSGEDFYFLQKLLKTSPLLIHNRQLVFPAARFSARVFFGTGPAMIKGRNGDWSSYPIYSTRQFRHVKDTYDLFPLLWEKNMPTPMDYLLNTSTSDIWDKLRQNNNSCNQFVRACQEKVDGLRILQFLKASQWQLENKPETAIFLENLRAFNISLPVKVLNEVASYQHLSQLSVNALTQIRELMFLKERKYQQSIKQTSL